MQGRQEKGMTMRLPNWVLLAAALTSASVWAAACAEPERANRPAPPAAAANVAAVSPALADYDDRIVEGQLWHRPGLSPRERSLVTAAALITRSQIIDMRAHFGRALDNGVTAAELSEVITHLAF